MSALLDRAVSFAESNDKSGNPYLSDEEINEIVSVIPMTEPESDSEATYGHEETETQPDQETPSESATELESMTKAQLMEYADSIGVDVSASLTKAEIIDAIRGSEDA